MKTYVLMLSQVFPADHPKSGIPTGFQHKLQAALNGWSDHAFPKFHTIRANYPIWAKRFEQIYNNGYLHAIHVYPHRIHCYKNNENTGHSSPVNYAWFEYKKILPYINIQFPPSIYWIEK